MVLDYGHTRSETNLGSDCGLKFASDGYYLPGVISTKTAFRAPVWR